MDRKERFDSAAVDDAAVRHLQPAAGDSSGHDIVLTDNAKHPRADASTGNTLGRPPHTRPRQCK